MKREYVIVCNEHSGYYPSCLLFWGYYTQDNAEKRSFGGYTSNLDKCEMYTKEEIEKSGHKFPFYDKRMTKNSFKNQRDVAIKISDLENMGYRQMRFMVNP